ncbi:ankyrin repeat-containing domain protein [Aspergillus californicus]
MESQSFLYAATIGDTTTIEQEYLANNAILTARDPSGSTALHLATRHSKLDAIRLLLTYGLNSSITDHAGQSALHLAAQGKSTDVVDTLLKQGSNCSTRDKDGKTPISYAYSNPNLDILARFLDYAPVCGSSCTLTPEIILRSRSGSGLGVPRDSIPSCAPTKRCGGRVCA